MSTEKEWFSRIEAAEFLATLGVPLSAKTLENLACSKGADRGPPYVMSGWRLVRYRKADLEVWAASRRRIVNASVCTNNRD